MIFARRTDVDMIVVRDDDGDNRFRFFDRSLISAKTFASLRVGYKVAVIVKHNDDNIFRCNFFIQTPKFSDPNTNRNRARPSNQPVAPA